MIVDLIYLKPGCDLKFEDSDLSMVSLDRNLYSGYNVAKLLSTLTGTTC